MGVFSTDNRRENQMSRLVARLLNADPSLEPDHYASGIPALLLTYSGYPAGIPWERMRSAYARFETACDKSRRYEILHTLSLFSGQMKGQSLLVWEAVFRCDSDFRLRSAAAHAAMTLAPRTEEDKLAGVRPMMDYILAHPEAIALLDGAFLTCDLRLMPLLRETLAKLPLRGRFWDSFETAALSLPALTLLVEFIETTDDAEAIDSALQLLCRMPSTALTNPPLTLFHPFPESHPDYEKPQIIDAVTPMPAWMFGSTPPQVLHSWTCPEYLLRFLPHVQSKLTDAQKTALGAAWNRE